MKALHDIPEVKPSVSKLRLLTDAPAFADWYLAHPTIYNDRFELYPYQRELIERYERELRALRRERDYYRTTEFYRHLNADRG